MRKFNRIMFTIYFMIQVGLMIWAYNYFNDLKSLIIFCTMVIVAMIWVKTMNVDLG